MPPDAVGERRQQQGGAWIVYLGGDPDAQAWQVGGRRTQELDVKFERMNTPAALAPGLSLGHSPQARPGTPERSSTSSPSAACTPPASITLTAPTVLRGLQVRATDPAWRRAAGAQRFNACCPLDRGVEHLEQSPAGGRAAACRKKKRPFADLRERSGRSEGLGVESCFLRGAPGWARRLGGLFSAHVPRRPAARLLLYFAAKSPADPSCPAHGVPAFNIRWGSWSDFYRGCVASTAIEAASMPAAGRDTGRRA